MPQNPHAIAIEEFVIAYVEQQGCFLERGQKAVTPWRKKDHAALIFTRANVVSDAAWVARFHCASCLDPRSPPVTTWVAECLDAARAALPDDFAALGEVSTLVTSEAGGLEPL